ncbi:MAG: hypothetical protein LBS50_03400 [Prevotellaceae bacterium]|jgi:hypothetical protein|nr:hypothetical protein [Prevotellaceae bacterium]
MKNCEVTIEKSTENILPRHKGRVKRFVFPTLSSIREVTLFYDIHNYFSKTMKATNRQG